MTYTGVAASIGYIKGDRMKFTKVYNNIKFQGLDEQFTVTVISKGNTVEELMANAELVLVDEFGDEGPFRDLNEVTMSDYYMVQYDMTEEFINYSAQYYAKGC